MPAAQRLFEKTTILSLGLVTALLFVSCERKEAPAKTKEETGPKSYFPVDPVEVPQLASNNLALEPTEFLRSRADDQLNWQPWSPELLSYSEKVQKPIFAFVSGGKYPFAHPLLNELSDPENGFVDTFNENYVCTLVDIEAHPEMTHVASLLSQELRKSFSIPFIVWLSHEGSPIGWTPIQYNNKDKFSQVVDTAHLLVKNTWRDSQSYSILNSRDDNQLRIERAQLPVYEEALDRENHANLLVNQTSQLTALYDPTSQAIDLSGGLVPAGILQYYAQVSSLPELPNFLSSRCLRIVQDLPALLSKEPISDPLDRGIFSSRVSKDWSIPRFCKDLPTQSEMAMVYALAYSLTGQPRFQEAADSTLAFAENEFGKDGDGFGAFKSLRNDEFATDLFILPLKDLKESLSPREFEVLRIASSLGPEGNISIEVDPQRTYFRHNILRNDKSPQEIANELSLPIIEVSTLLASAKEKLYEQRKRRSEALDAFVVESSRVTENNALHAQALFLTGQLTGNNRHLEQGRNLLQFLKQKHYDQFEGLWRIPPSEGRRGVKARGRDYATLIAALLEAYRVDLISADLIWAEALARESIRALQDDEGLILEAPQKDILGDLPIYYNTMMISDSTWGSLLGSYEYFSRLTTKSPFAAASETITRRLHAPAERKPMNHTDYLSSLIIPVTNCVAVIHGDLNSPEMPKLRELLQEPRHRGVIMIRPDVLAKTNFIDFASIPRDSGVTLYRSERKMGTASTVEELRSLLETSLEPR